MKDRLKISVAMCTYNGAEYVQEQLDSIDTQRRPPDELIICDDGSTDATISICEAYGQQVSFPVCLTRNKETLGSAKNFEQAVKFCQGDIIALADQDDVWLPEKLIQLEAAFLANASVGVVFTDAYVVDASLHSLGYRLWQYVHFTRRDQERLLGGEATTILLKRNVVTGATMALRARQREMVLPIPPSWMHDEWIAFMASVCSCLSLIREPLVMYRQHPGSQIGARKKGVSTRLSEVRQRDLLPAQAKLEQFIAARECLSAIDETLISNRVMEQLEAKIHHMQIRANLQSLTGARWPALLELAARRYHRYSNGFSSFIRDILS